MDRKTRVTAMAGVVTLLSACAAQSPAVSFPTADAPVAPSVRWVSGPVPEVRTLLLEPAAVAHVQGPAIEASTLSIGAFFSRYNTAQGPLDQLALLVQLDGLDPMALLSSEASLLLEMDGVVFQGQPGITGNSMKWETTDTGRRALMIIPITRPALEALSQAHDVRGRVGLWGAFEFPGETRVRFGEIVRGLPDGAPLDPALATPSRRGVITGVSSGELR